MHLVDTAPLQTVPVQSVPGVMIPGWVLGCLSLPDCWRDVPKLAHVDVTQQCYPAVSPSSVTQQHAQLVGRMLLPAAPSEGPQLLTDQDAILVMVRLL